MKCVTFKFEKAQTNDVNKGFDKIPMLAHYNVTNNIQSKINDFGENVWDIYYLYLIRMELNEEV